MKINFSAWSIHKPLPAVLGFILLTMLGLYSFQKLPIVNFADIDIPTITVSVSYAGATPSQLETEVTRKIEDAIAGLESVEHITSTITDGHSNTVIEFTIGHSTMVALDDVRDAVTRIRAQLPQDINDPVISRVTFAGLPLVTYAIESNENNVAELSWLVDDAITKQLRAIPGVGNVVRMGGVDREIRIDLKPDRLLAFNVTAGDVSSQLKLMQAEQPGGRSTIAGAEQSIRTLGTVSDVATLKSFPIVLSDGRRVRLDELAEVADRYAEQRQLAFADGKPVVAFQIQRMRGAGETEVADRVQESLDAFQASHAGVHIKEVQANVPMVRKLYHSSMHMLYEGGVLAMVVVFLFLRDWRATYISAMALPLSVIPTFWVMSLFNIALSSLTLLALSLVIGILVDDAIVEIENIVRHLREGKSPKQAALEAAEEIGLAVIGTSLTLAAIFLPVAFMPGVPGLLFKQFAITCVTAVLFSLVVARLITPMVASFQLKGAPHIEQRSIIEEKYLRLVDWTLSHRRTTLAVAFGVFVFSMVLSALLPTGLLTADDRGQAIVNVELPPGARLADTIATTQQVEKILRAQSEVTRIFSAVGNSAAASLAGGSSNDVRKATIYATLTPTQDRKRSQAEFQSAMQPLLGRIPGARITFSATNFGEGLAIYLSGEDPAALQAAAERVTRDLRTIPGLGAVTSSAALMRPEIAIKPDFDKAAQLGVVTASLADAIRIGTTGDVDFRLAKFNLPARQIPIRVQIEESARDTLDLLRLLRVPARDGTVPLESVASIQLSSGPAEINRYDRYRNVVLNASLNGQMLGVVQKQIDALPSLQSLPEGVRRIQAGDSERYQQLFVGFALAMVTGIFCVYGVLALLFNDLLQPVTILVALPLSIGGAAGALAITGLGLTLPSLIGILMLMGIAVKNSILLVDYAVIAEQQGMNQREALLDACGKRARPIIMTSLAMAAGMAPTAIDFAGGSGFRRPMAIAVLGGLVTSTILSLLVVPAAYTYVADFESWWRRKRHRAQADAENYEKRPTLTELDPADARVD